MKSIRFFSPLYTALYGMFLRTFSASWYALLSVLIMTSTSQELNARDVGQLEEMAPMAFPSAPAPKDIAGFPKQMPDMGQFPGQAGMPPLPEGVTEADFQAMVDEISKQLEKMSPEEIEKLQKEAEEMLVNSGVSREEIEAFKQGPAGYPGEMPGQLPTAAPQAPFAPQPLAPIMPVQELIPVKAEPLTPLITEAEVGKILKIIIRTMSALREQIALSDALKTLRPWKYSLNDIIFYVRVFDSKQEHRKRLATKEFSTLFGLLKKLAAALEEQEYNLYGQTDELGEEENPYDTLRIPQNASAKKIKKAAETLLAEKDPEALRQRLTEEGATELDIRRQVSSAKTARKQIQEAYEKLTPPENRKQTNRRLKANKDQQKASEQALRRASAELNAVFSQINSQLIQLAEEFLKKYEPAELARKKEMDAAEAKQRKEQEARAQQKPSPAPFQSLEQFYPPSFDSGKSPFDLGRSSPFSSSALTGDRSTELQQPSADKKTLGGSRPDEKKRKGSGKPGKGEDEKTTHGKGKGKPSPRLEDRTGYQWDQQLSSFDNALKALEEDLGGAEVIKGLTKKAESLPKTKSKAEQETLLQEMTETIGNRQEQVGSLRANFDELEKMGKQTKLSDEEKSKLLARYAEIKKKHPDAIKLLELMKQKPEEPATTETDDTKQTKNAGQASAEQPRTATQNKESKEKEEKAKRGDQDTEDARAKAFREKHGAAAQKLTEEQKKQLAAEEKKAIAQQLAALAEALLKIKTTAPESRNELEEIKNFVTGAQELLENERFPIDAKKRAELLGEFNTQLKAKTEQFEEFKKICKRWQTLINTINRSENNDQKDQYAQQVKELTAETEALGYPEYAADRDYEALPDYWKWMVKGWRSLSRKARPYVSNLADLLEQANRFLGFAAQS